MSQILSWVNQSSCIEFSGMVLLTAFIPANGPPGTHLLTQNNPLAMCTGVVMQSNLQIKIDPLPKRLLFPYLVYGAAHFSSFLCHPK